MRTISQFFQWWWHQLKLAMQNSWIEGEKSPNGVILEVVNFSPPSPESHAELSGRILARLSGCETFISDIQHPPEAPLLLQLKKTVYLRVPPHMVLHRKLALPNIANADLNAAIGFEIERQMPFGLCDVLWNGYGLVREKQRLKLSVLIIPKATIAPLLGVLREMGVKPGLIENGRGRIPIAGSGEIQIDLFQKVLIGVFFCSLLVLLCIPFIKQQHQLNEVNEKMVALMPVQKELSQLNVEITSFKGSREIVFDSHKNGMVLEVLAALTKALPNGTWLNQLSMTSSVITFSGESNNAARLISALEASPIFWSPSFIGPISRAANTDLDIFSIQAQLRNRG